MSELNRDLPSKTGPTQQAMGSQQQGPSVEHGNQASGNGGLTTTTTTVANATATTSNTASANQATTTTNANATNKDQGKDQCASAPKQGTQTNPNQSNQSNPANQQNKPKQQDTPKVALKVLEVGFDPDKGPVFLDIPQDLFLQLRPEHKSSVDACAPFVCIKKQKELKGDDEFQDYEGNEDFDDDYYDEDDDDELDSAEGAEETEEEEKPYEGEFNQDYLYQFDLKQSVRWVYPGASWFARSDENKRAGIRERLFNTAEKRTRSLANISQQLENYYSEIRKGNRLKTDEKRTMLALLEERNRAYMPSGYIDFREDLDTKGLTIAELDALNAFKRRLRSLMFYAREREIDYKCEIGEKALLWFHVKDANMLNQLRSFNGSGILFVRAEQCGLAKTEGYDWYVNMRPKSFPELADNIKKFIGWF